MGKAQKTLLMYWRASTRYPVRFAIVLIGWPLGVTIQNLVLPLITSQAVNKLMEVYNSGMTDYWSIFWPYLALFLLAGTVGQSILAPTLFTVARLQTRVRRDLADKVYHHLLAHSLSFHANSFSGSLIAQATRFASGHTAVSDILILQGLSLFVKSAIAVIIIAFFSLPIAGAILAWTLLFIWLNITLTRRRMKYSRRAAKADSTVTAHLADSVSNIGAIKAFAGEKTESSRYHEKTNDWSQKKYTSWGRGIAHGTVTAIMMILLQFGILALSIYGVMNNQIQLGTLLLIQVYITMLMSALWNLTNLMRGLEQALSDASEMTEILDTSVEVKDPEQPETPHITRGAIRFDNVSFTHNDAKNNETLFRRFNLDIKAGEKIGLVGHSGSGKTTLTKLLLRFHDIDGGEIAIDGQDISHITQSDLRRHIAYVPQEPLLFHRSLRENIAYGKPDASDKEIENAAKQAHAIEFIEKLPEGLDTIVGERGVKLSGGQRQRIAIARAILKDAPILVLDEATSALDSESEKLIQDALKKLMKNRTAIVIAHRLSTIQNLDRIIVLADGEIVEQGTHTQLLQKNGTYAELWKHQSGGFLEE